MIQPNILPIFIPYIVYQHVITIVALKEKGMRLIHKDLQPDTCIPHPASPTFLND